MTNNRLIMYHNPLCSKSQETLQILENRNLSPDVVEYLVQPPTRQELKEVIEMLGIPARDLLRTNEQVYDDAELDDDTLTDDEIIEAICQHPKLMQRPIVISGTQAIIGRPPTRVLEILA
ncbi:MAG: arsenate reductase (glutaredoxin) [Gammaproteobacteria bacterium]|nr:arsenate reductase (glutaredoxin) [Gammaproteobacteria bacterium]